MKKLVYRLLVIFVPIGLLVMTVNYLVDPANMFSEGEYVSGISDILIKGHNVDGVANYDERALQEQMIRKLPYRPDVVVLGSSRIMELGTDFFPGKKLLNCGVSHANINDVLAIIGLLDSLDKLPEEIVINLDPHLICLGGTTEWQRLSPYRSFYLNKIHAPDLTSAPPLISRKLAALMSFEYFEKSLPFLFNGKKHYRDVGTQRPAAYGRFSDGTICYPASYAFPDTMKVASDARAVGNREETTLDPMKLGQLKSLLDYLASRQVGVMFVMLPYHNQYYLKMNQRYPNNFSGYDMLYHQLAGQRHLQIRGGFDAIALGIPEDQFYDSYHCSKQAIKKAFNHF
jgi:hypothetical protein